MSRHHRFGPHDTGPAAGDVTLPTVDFHEAVAELRRRTSGRIVTQADTEYDTARAAWDLTVDQRPSVIALVATAADVTTAVRFARRYGLRVAVQSTGHGLDRTADGALLVVTTALDDVTIDPSLGVAHVAAGATWGRVLDAAHPHGLAPAMVSSSHVGAVGSTLGGGMGWLARRHGLAADSVVAFDVVTPDGTEARASATENPELFSALRGAGAGTFGIVVAMTIRLHPVADVYAGSLVYPFDAAHRVLPRWREWVADAPEALTSSVALVNVGRDDTHAESSMRGRPWIVVRGCWSGDDLADGQRLVDEWSAWREPVLDRFAPMPFTAIDTVSGDPVHPQHTAATTAWADTISDDLIDIVLAAATPRHGETPLLGSCEIRHAGGAVRRLAHGSVDRTGRQHEFLVHLRGSVASTESAVLLEALLRRLRTSLAPHVSGPAYLNLTTRGKRHDRIRSSFAPDQWARLTELKAALDPEHRFAHGIDIPPT